MLVFTVLVGTAQNLKITGIELAIQSQFNKSWEGL